jgi:hypothetical protein
MCRPTAVDTKTYSSKFNTTTGTLGQHESHTRVLYDVWPNRKNYLSSLTVTVSVIIEMCN